MEGIGDAAFDWRAAEARDRTEAADENKHCVQSLFIEPVEWMEKDISQIEGKVLSLSDIAPWTVPISP